MAKLRISEVVIVGVAAALGAAIYLATRVSGQEPADGTLAEPYTCEDGSIIYQSVYRVATHSWEAYQTPADCPATQICTPYSVRNQLTDCWNGVPYGGEICSDDGTKWNLAGTTCPPQPVDTTLIMMDSGTIYVGDDEAITGGLSMSGVGIPGKTVSITITKPDGTHTATTNVITDANGQCSVVYAADLVGGYVVNGSFAGDASYKSSSGSTSFTAVAKPTPTYNYKVVGSQVLNSSGAVVNTSADFTTALRWAIENHPNTITYVPSGTYNVVTSAPINPATGITLVGDGPGASGTVLNFTSTNAYNAQVQVINADNVAFKMFRITGNGAIQFKVSANSTHGGYLVEDVIAYQIGSIQQFCFQTYVYAGNSTTPPGVIDGLTFRRVQAIAPGCAGFQLMGTVNTVNGVPVWHDPYGAKCKNVLFEDCVASYCGYYSRWDQWACGFHILEGCNIENVHCLRCSADHNYDDGFHFEEWFMATNVVYEDCDASYNGINNPDTTDPWVGLGYAWYTGTSGVPAGQTPAKPTLINCTGYGNRDGDTPDGDLSPSDTTTNFVISKDSNGATLATNVLGAVVYTNSNPTLVFQYACDHGAVVYVTPDTYYMNGLVLMNNGNSLLSGGAKLIATAAAYCFMRPREQGDAGITNSNITVDGFDMDGMGRLTNCFAVNTAGASTLKHYNISVKNCTATNANCGIYMHNVDGGLIENVEAHHGINDGNGIDVGFCYNIMVRNCSSHDNMADGYDLNADILNASNVTLENCESYNNCLSGNSTFNRSGVVITQNGTGFKLINCYIHNEKYFGIHDAGYNTEISGCTVEDNAQVGIQSGWRAGTTSVINNTIRRCGTGVQLLGTTTVSGNQISSCGCGIQNGTAAMLTTNTFTGNTQNIC